MPDKPLLATGLLVLNIRLKVYRHLYIQHNQRDIISLIRYLNFSDVEVKVKGKDSKLRGKSIFSFDAQFEIWVNSCGLQTEIRKILGGYRRV